jgi:ubiquinone/menaquinone biosynthesis C-methylase UbiE
MEIGHEVQAELQSRDWQNVFCPACGTDKSHLAYRRADQAAVVSCSECGLLYLNPRPLDSSILSFYDKSYFAEGGHGSGYRDYMMEQAIEMNSGKHPAFLALYLLHRHSVPDGKKILDVGCGGGHLLSLARRAGYSVQGLDLSAHIAAEARSELSIDVFAGDLKDANFAAASFDVVSALEVIEHLTNPVEWLLEIHRILKPSGILLLSTPNAKCAEAYGEQWLGFNASFEHLTFFAPDTAARLLETGGFKIVEERTFGYGGPVLQTGRPGLKATFKGAARRAIGLVPALLAGVQRQRNLRRFRSTEVQPHGHTLWLIARKGS